MRYEDQCAALSKAPPIGDSVWRIHYLLINCTYYTELWLELYPGITNRVTLSDADLRHVASYLGSSEYAPPGVLLSPKETKGVLAARLLKQVTGQDFHAADEVEKWIESNGHSSEGPPD